MADRQRTVEGLDQMNILHIAAHLGGGAGKAISGIAMQGQGDFSDTHRIILLQEPEKSGYVQACREHGVSVSVWNGNTVDLRWADVIVVSWWNHPVMARFLRNFPAISVPVILWSHINGCHYPMLPYRLAAEFERVLFTSPYSLENPMWTGAEREQIRKCSALVWGIGRFEPEQIEPKAAYPDRDSFTVGYVGTLNYGKLHPRFFDYSRAVCERIPTARFVMAGDRDETLERDVRLAGLEDRFSFPGYVSDVPALMSRFDVFGYLLNPEHYGTTENVLLEAMACSLPVVVLRQNVERFIVPTEAGYLVETPRQYADCLEKLRRDLALRERLGRAARNHVLKQYDAGENTARFRAACCQAADRLGRNHDFSFLGNSPWEWFRFCLGERERRLMEAAGALLENGSSAQLRQLLQSCPPILREERKSSLRHFAAVYPQDRTLQALKQQMEQECNHGGNQTEL